MTFVTSHTLSIVDWSPPSVQLSGAIIDAVSESKYVGIILDRKLTFSAHVEYLKGKAIGRLKMFGRTCKYVSEQNSLLMYKTLMSPIFDYTDVVYDSLCARDSHALQKLQNSALHIVLKTDWHSHVADLHRDLNLHYLADKWHFHTLNQVYKCVNELALPPLCQQLHLVSERHNVGIRHALANKLQVPQVRLELSKKAFKYRGPQMWNLLDEDVSCKESLRSFKHAIVSSDSFEIVWSH